jgi:hypothetical protein
VSHGSNRFAIFTDFFNPRPLLFAEEWLDPEGKKKKER